MTKRLLCGSLLFAGLVVLQSCARRDPEPLPPPPPGKEHCRVVVVNSATRSVRVFINDRFVGKVPKDARDSFRVRPGRVVLEARKRLGAREFGPQVVHLEPGEKFEWHIGRPGPAPPRRGPRKR